MTRNLYEPTDQSRIVQNRYKIKDTRQKPLASQWIIPVNEGDPIPDDEPEYTPELENDWLQPDAGSGFQKFAFRLHYDGSIEFQGHLDTAGGGSDSTVAVTLPGANVGEPNYLAGLEPRLQYGDTIIIDTTANTFQKAAFLVDGDTGEVTMYFPVT